jgi:hypothetical protein
LSQVAAHQLSPRRGGERKGSGGVAPLPEKVGSQRRSARGDDPGHADRVRAARHGSRAHVAPGCLRCAARRASDDQRRRQLPPARGPVLPSRGGGDERGRPLATAGGFWVVIDRTRKGRPRLRRNRHRDPPRLVVRLGRRRHDPDRHGVAARAETCRRLDPDPRDEKDQLRARTLRRSDSVGRRDCAGAPAFYWIHRIRRCGQRVRHALVPGGDRARNIDGHCSRPDVVAGYEVRPAGDFTASDVAAAWARTGRCVRSR